MCNMKVFVYAFGSSVSHHSGFLHLTLYVSVYVCVGAYFGTVLRPRLALHCPPQHHGNPHTCHNSHLLCASEEFSDSLGYSFF